MSPKLSIIIVSYNTRGLLKNCLETVFKNISLSKEVFVVDNLSPDKSAVMVAKDFPKVKLIKNSKNYGYNFANNQALKKARGNYLLLLNPDTMVTKQAIEQLVNYLEKHKKVGIIGPQIINPKGEVDFSAYPLPNLRDTIEEGLTTYLLPHNRFFSRLVYRRKFAEKIKQEKVFEAGWVSGAAFIIRKKVFDIIGPKDESLYSYAEEADWSIKTKRIGYRTVYFPLSQIVHVGSASSNQNWQLKCARVLSSYKERIYFAKKYFSPLAYYILKICLLFELWAKISFRAVTCLQEPKRTEYLKAYNSALDNLIGIENNKINENNLTN